MAIINSKKNMDTLYSRSIGPLKAKREYFIALDNNDFLYLKKCWNSLFK